jgi:hypothetical protein
MGLGLGDTTQKTSQKKTKKKQAERGQKNPEKGDWRPCSQGDRAPVKRMAPPRKLWGSSSKLMEPLYALQGNANHANGALV